MITCTCSDGGIVVWQTGMPSGTAQTRDDDSASESNEPASTVR